MGSAERFSGKVALVTGGTSGIGAAVCRRLLEEGARVASLDLEAKAPEGVFGLAGDVSRSADVEDAVAAVHEELGHVDVLVCSAGIPGASLPTVNVPDEEWKRVMAINADGVFFCNRSVIPSMVERGYGRIVNISSVIGETGNIGQANYAAAKSGLFGLTMTLALEGASKGITVNCVAPGFVATEMVAAVPQEILDRIVERIPAHRLGRPDAVARVVAFLADPASEYITGQVFSINGGLNM